MILGVDPGKSGAVALLDDTGALLDVADMPVIGKIISPHTLSGVLGSWAYLNDTLEQDVFAGRAIAVIEDVHAMPKQGVTSVFSFGRALGVVEGVLGASGWSLRYVPPARWKKDLRLSSDKGESRRRAIELWPTKAELFARVKDDGRAEAALIGWWHLTFGAREVAA
jgi:crossover junction endodeoxyribonuclease RuvC